MIARTKRVNSGQLKVIGDVTDEMREQIINTVVADCYFEEETVEFGENRIGRQWRFVWDNFITVKLKTEKNWFPPGDWVLRVWDEFYTDTDYPYRLCSGVAMADGRFNATYQVQ